MTDNHFEKLHNAARKGRINSVKALLASGVDLHAMNDDGENALILAAREAHPRMVRMLMTLGARFDSNEMSNRMAFPLAMLDQNSTLTSQYLNSESDPTFEPWSSIKKPTALRVERTCRLLLEVTELLITAGADINAPDEQGNTPLHNFISSDLDDCVKLLIRHGADVNAVNGHGDPPLRESVCANQKHIFMLLLEAGADPNIGDYPPIHLVSDAPDWLPQLRRMIAAGADVNARDGLGRTALHNAWGYSAQHRETLQTLLDFGADATIADAEGFLPCDYAMMAFLNKSKRDGNGSEPEQAPDYPICFNPHYARFVWGAMRGDEKMLEDSLNDGVPDTIKTLALHEAIISGSHNCCRILLDNGANPNGRELHTYPPLLTAASMLDVAAAEILLEYGANPELANCDGQKPLYMACQAGTSCFDNIYSPQTKRMEITRLLLAHGADVDGADNYGFTPLRQAIVAADDIDLVRLLLEHGARPDREDWEGRTPMQCAVDHGRREMRELLDQL